MTVACGAGGACEVAAACGGVGGGVTAVVGSLFTEDGGLPAPLPVAVPVPVVVPPGWCIPGSTWFPGRVAVLPVPVFVAAAPVSAVAGDCTPGSV